MHISIDSRYTEKELDVEVELQVGP